MRIPCGCAVLCIVLTLAFAPAAQAFIGPFTGVGHGDLDRFHHMEDPGSDPNDSADDFRSDSNDRYRVRFTYSFRIQNDGTVIGRGDGSYLSTSFHLEGKNREDGGFNCDPKVVAKPFVVDVTGRANNGRLRLRFSLLNAREHNDETYCGGNYSAFATDTTFMADSLDVIQDTDGPIVVDQANPTIRPMRETIRTGDRSDGRVIHHEWEISIRPPPPPPPPGGGGGPGTAQGPRSPNTRICTIDGTAGPDRLVGTAGNDVICGFGGDDVISGRGGHDLIYGSFGADSVKGGAGRDSLLGNSGADLLLARDRKPDFVSGGRGADRGAVDRGRDTVRSVEIRIR